MSGDFLLIKTPAAWAPKALADPLSLLNDHAHLEKKAAANAMELLNRYPWPPAPEKWSTSICSIIYDEVSHLKQVLRLMHKRHSRLANFHRNPYAGLLGREVRRGQGTAELIDRLLTSCLIEARSCERFGYLADEEFNKDIELRRFYKALSITEAKHYREYIALAEMIDPGESKSRLPVLLEKEAKIIQATGSTIRMHSWV